MERSMGLTAGVSDLFLAVPNKHYSGFWIELKASGKKPSELQNDWLLRSRLAGYRADWYDSYDSAKSAIVDYLEDR